MSAFGSTRRFIAAAIIFHILSTRSTIDFRGKGRHGSEFPCDSIGRGALVERSSHDLARLRASRAFPLLSRPGVREPATDSQGIRSSHSAAGPGHAVLLGKMLLSLKGHESGAAWYMAMNVGEWLRS